MITRLLAHPATRGLDLDSPETTALRRQIVRAKPFLEAIYDEWYGLLISRLPATEGQILEIGSGGGFLDDYITGLITSEVVRVPNIDVAIDARFLPFREGGLSAIVMTNVFHHIPDVELFLGEAQRCLTSGGRMLMIEPWNTPWSRFVHKHFHSEPMLPATEEWAFPESGPLSGANAALPWIVFERDRIQTERKWPHLRLIELKPLMPFRYVVSGGVSMRSLQPKWMFKVWRLLEKRLGIEKPMAVLALIAVERL